MVMEKTVRDEYYYLLFFSIPMFFRTAVHATRSAISLHAGIIIKPTSTCFSALSNKRCSDRWLNSCFGISLIAKEYYFCLDPQGSIVEDSGDGGELQVHLIITSRSYIQIHSYSLHCHSFYITTNSV